MTRPFTHIIVPLDGSRLAEGIMPVVAELATRCTAHVTLLHVVEGNPPEEVHGEPHLGTAAEAEAYLVQVAERLRAAGVAVESRVVSVTDDGVAPTIAKVAREVHADLIALATHGRGGLRGLLFGRIAQQVLQLARRPVLVVRARRGMPAEYRCQRILVPLDGTPDAEAALPVAWALAEQVGARVQLVRVVPTLETVSVRERAPVVFLPATSGALLDLEARDANDYLVRLLASRPAGVVAEGVVRRGDVIAELAAASRDADLVVMSTHGKAGLEGWLSGSVAARLLERLEAPLLLIPAERKDGRDGDVDRTRA
ncbi:universal stress protein [Thermorudis peleae]|uniref:universal stress protein n=1 Tax=Thermorudis peleae TaxID=1382356 RepID=UPI0009E01FAD|nr:universal stress protein [Thermorudis peleae]